MHAAAINFGWKYRMRGNLKESLQNLIAWSSIFSLDATGKYL